MRITHTLWRQHIGRMTKRHWWIQGQQTIRDTKAEKILVANNIQVVDALEVAALPKPPRYIAEYKPLAPRPQAMNETHPDWKEKPCLTYKTNGLLVEGIEQAQLLAKSETILDGLPEKLQSLRENPSEKIKELIPRLVGSSHLFDAQQVKLPKLKDPNRPAWVFPRVYGITDVRKTNNLVQKLLRVCELTSDPRIVRQRKIMNDGQVRTYIERENDLLHIESNVDTMITADKLLTPMSNPDATYDTPFPDILPLLPTISLEPNNIYNLRDHYPLASGSMWINPHTIFIDYDSELVQNKTQLPVKETQILARSLMKSFATAACCAKQKFGAEIVDLPEPITVQCVQSDSKWFHFSVFQLNTLNVSGSEGKRNVWWSKPRIDLYEKAEYIDGVPTLQGYNPEVFEQILAFYRNV